MKLDTLASLLSPFGLGALRHKDTPPRNPYRVPENPRLPDLAETIALFDRLADRKDIAFAYAETGCQARAHLMCIDMIEQGYAPQKAWAFEFEGLLRPSLPNGQEVRWSWHVAPAIVTEIEPGLRQSLVIDPSLFDGPVTLDYWRRAMRASAGSAQIVEWGACAAKCKGDYLPYPLSSKSMHGYTSRQTTREAKDLMKAYIEALNGGTRRLVMASDLRQQAQPQDASPPQGETWQTDETSLLALKSQQRIAAGAAKPGEMRP